MTATRAIFTPLPNPQPYIPVGTGIGGLRGLGNTASGFISPPFMLAGVGLGQMDPISPGVRAFWSLASIAGTGLGAYHGWKRHHSGWGAAGWALFGMLLPIISIPVSLAQGFAKPKGRR